MAEKAVEKYRFILPRFAIVLLFGAKFVFDCFCLLNSNNSTEIYLLFIALCHSFVVTLCFFGATVSLTIGALSGDGFDRRSHEILLGIIRIMLLAVTLCSGLLVPFCAFLLLGSVTCASLTGTFSFSQLSVILFVFAVVASGAISLKELADSKKRVLSMGWIDATHE